MLIFAACAAAAAAGAFLIIGRPLNALPLPTTGSPEGEGMQAEYVGRVTGDVRTGCLTLGDGGAVVVWPKGFYALDDPPRVMRSRRSVALYLEEEVSLGGGFVPGRVDGCGGNEQWVVSSAERLGP